MKFIKKHWFWLSVVGLVALYIVTRFYNILSLPIFTDEAIYIRWAQIAGNDASWRFISLTDGKQPLFVWIAMLLLKVIDDPLFAGRLVSVMAGFGTMIGLFFLTNTLFHDKKIAIAASVMYVLYPFSLLYDRMALYDSLVAMFMVWSLYFEVLLVRARRLDLAFILGLVIGGGMLNKSSVFFAIYLLPFSLLLFDFKQKKWKKELLKWALFAFIAVMMAELYYAILRLSPYYYIIDEKNYVFIYSFSEWLQHPFIQFGDNLRRLTTWLATYFSYVWLIFIPLAFIFDRKYLREKLLLLVWFIVPFVALAVFGRLIYPRYILFMTMPLLVLTAFSLVSWLRILRVGFGMKVLFCAIFFFFPLISSFYILTDFQQAPIPSEDKGQYFTSWPSGGGVNETVAYLKEQSKNQKIFVGTQGTFGLMPYALEIYFQHNPNVIIKGYWPVNDTPPGDLIAASKKMPTYVVFYQECLSCKNITGIAPQTWPVKKILQIKKSEKDTFYTLYKVTSQ